MWTMNNTEGFTQDELDAINAALDAAWAEADDSADDSYLKALSDAANNAWRPGMTAAELKAAIAARF